MSIRIKTLPLWPMVKHGLIYVFPNFYFILLIPHGCFCGINSQGKMGKKQHSKDRMYITKTEWATEWGGAKSKDNSLPFKQLPFYCCSYAPTPKISILFLCYLLKFLVYLCSFTGLLSYHLKTQFVLLTAVCLI